MQTPRRTSAKGQPARPKVSRPATKSSRATATKTAARPKSFREIAAEVEQKQPELAANHAGMVEYMETLGRAAGAYFRSLKENAIPHDSAVCLVENWHELVTGYAADKSGNDPELYS